MSNRIRQIPHLEGNFATSISIIPSTENCVELRKYLQAASIFLGRVTEGHIAHITEADFHLSLSKMGFLKPHFINAFLDKFRVVMSGLKKSVIFLCPRIQLYLNEGKNTAFAGIPVDQEISPNCLDLISCVDGVMTEFGLDKYYYPNPSPHVSLACSSSVRGHEMSIHQSESLELEVEDLNDLRIDVNFIVLQIGKSIHRFPLGCPCLLRFC